MKMSASLVPVNGEKRPNYPLPCKSSLASDIGRYAVAAECVRAKQLAFFPRRKLALDESKSLRRTDWPVVIDASAIGGVLREE